MFNICQVASFINSVAARSTVVARDYRRQCLLRCRCESGTCYHRWSRHCRHCRLSSVHWRLNCFRRLYDNAH